MMKRSIVVIVILVVIVCVFLGSRTLLTLWVKGYYDGARYAEMKSFFDSPMHFPKEYAEIPNHSPELLAAGENNHKLYIRHKITEVDFSLLETLQEGAMAPKNFWDGINKSLTSIQSYTDGLIAFAKMPGYDMDAWYKEPGSEVPNFLTMQVGAKALLFRSFSFSNKNEWDEAFADALAVFRLTQRNPASTIITHLIAVAMQNMAAETVLTLANQCNDPAVLKKALQEMNRLDSKVNLCNLDRGTFLDILVWLRGRKEENPHIDLSPGKNGYYYYSQYMDLTFLNTDGSSTKHWPKQLPSFGLLKQLRKVGFRRQVDELMYSAFNASNINLMNRENCAVAKYRLAQITLAAKIHQLEAGNVVDRASALIPKYLPKQPTDPFFVEGGGADYCYDGKLNVFYSIGPDLKDDCNQVFYNPSNGMTSAGDISPRFAQNQ